MKQFLLLFHFFKYLWLRLAFLAELDEKNIRKKIQWEKKAFQGKSADLFSAIRSGKLNTMAKSKDTSKIPLTTRGRRKLMPLSLVPLPSISVACRAKKSHRYTNIILRAISLLMPKRKNKMWFVTESKVFRCECECVPVLATGSKVYFQTAWDKRQCKIHLCSNEETLFEYMYCAVHGVVQEMDWKERRNNHGNCWYCNVRHFISWMDVGSKWN